MADNVDMANDLAQWRLDLALKANKPALDADSLEHCRDCRQSIPQARQMAVKGCTRCAECQGFFEQYGVRHAG